MALPLTLNTLIERRVPVHTGARGIYFLFNGEELVYVGKTVRGAWSRISEHLKDKKFDYYVFHEAPLKVSEQEIFRLESYYIVRFRPKYNKAGIKLSAWGKENKKNKKPKCLQSINPVLAEEMKDDATFRYIDKNNKYFNNKVFEMSNIEIIKNAIGFMSVSRFCKEHNVDCMEFKSILVESNIMVFSGLYHFEGMKNIFSKYKKYIKT